MGVWGSAGGGVQLTRGEPWWAMTPKALWPEGLEAEFAASSLWSEQYGDRQQVCAACFSFPYLNGQLPLVPGP